MISDAKLRSSYGINLYGYLVGKSSLSGSGYLNKSYSYVEHITEYGSSTIRSIEHSTSSKTTGSYAEVLARDRVASTVGDGDRGDLNLTLVSAGNFERNGESIAIVIETSGNGDGSGVISFGEGRRCNYNVSTTSLGVSSSTTGHEGNLIVEVRCLNGTGNKEVIGQCCITDTKSEDRNCKEQCDD